MLLISHRGNLKGPDPLNENKKETIVNCIKQGYHVEIDVRIIENKIYLGHDTPDYIVEESFLVDNKDYLWIHCKNLEALSYLTKLGLNTFYHNKDDYVLTSKGIIWSYPGNIIDENCVSVMPEWNCDITKFNKKCYGICSDYVSYFKSYKL